MNHSTDHLFHGFSEQAWKDSPPGTEDETTEERMFRVFPEWWQGLLAEDDAWEEAYRMTSEKRYPDYYYHPMGNNPLSFAVQSMTIPTLPAQSTDPMRFVSPTVDSLTGKILNKRSQELLRDLTTPSSGTTWLVGDPDQAGAPPPTTTTVPQLNTGIEPLRMVLEEFAKSGFASVDSVTIRFDASGSVIQEVTLSFPYGMQLDAWATSSE